MPFTKTTRKAISCDLSKFCLFANKNDQIELTEWSNGEGFDVAIVGTEHKNISLTTGELQAIRSMVDLFEYNLLGDS